MTSTPTTTTRVHYIGNAHVSRAACGRQVLAWREDAPAHTTDRAAVTCLACLQALLATGGAA